MSDPKVLHEWTSKHGSEIRLVQYPDWMDMQIKEPDGAWHPTNEGDSDDWEEIARLAASVAALTQQLADCRRALLTLAHWQGIDGNEDPALYGDTPMAENVLEEVQLARSSAQAAQPGRE